MVSTFSLSSSTMLGLGVVFKALLLLVNAMAVLHEERFLRKGIVVPQPSLCSPFTFLCFDSNLTCFVHRTVGWSEQDAAIDGGVKLQIVNLLKAFRVLRCKFSSSQSCYDPYDRVHTNQKLLLSH